MHRRPWPIVFLALIQLFTPIGSVFSSAIANGVDFGTMFLAIWRKASFIDQFTIFYMPVILAGLIFFTKRIGLYLVTLSVLVTLGFNVYEFIRSDGSVPIWMLIGVSAVNLALVGYLFLPSVREVFLNPAIRWWEHAPRYIVNLPAAVMKNEIEHTCHMHDISIGGASLECPPGKIAKGDIVYLKFHFQERLFGFQCEVMYERTLSPEFRKYGLRRLGGALTGETLSLEGLIEDLRRAKYPVTRPDSDTTKSLIEWSKQAARSPKAWVPQPVTRPAAPAPGPEESKADENKT